MKTHRIVTSLGIGCALALVLSFPLPAQSQTWLLDFGDSISYRGISVVSPDSNGNTWNSLHWDYVPSLLDINGNPTSAAYGLDLLGGTDSYNGPAGDTSAGVPATIGNTVFNPGALGNLGITNAVYDYFVSAKFQIQGLDPTKQYKLTFFGSHKFSADDATTYSVYSSGYATVLQSASLNVQTPGFPWLHNEDTVATITASPQLDTTMWIGFLGANGNDGYLNAMQIEVVPEPATVALVGLGLLSLVALRRRAS
jgi:hypothetical protein